MQHNFAQMGTSKKKSSLVAEVSSKSHSHTGELVWKHQIFLVKTMQILQKYILGEHFWSKNILVFRLLCFLWIIFIAVSDDWIFTIFANFQKCRCKENWQKTGRRLHSYQRRIARIRGNVQQFAIICRGTVSGKLSFSYMLLLFTINWYNIKILSKVLRDRKLRLSRRIFEKIAMTVIRNSQGEIGACGV